MTKSPIHDYIRRLEQEIADYQRIISMLAENMKALTELFAERDGEAE